MPDGLEAADLADVLADLVRVADPDPDEFELGVADDLGDHHLADETGTPDDDALGHVERSYRIISPALTSRCWPVTALA